MEIIKTVITTLDILLILLFFNSITVLIML